MQNIYISSIIYIILIPILVMALMIINTHKTMSVIFKHEWGRYTLRPIIQFIFSLSQFIQFQVSRDVMSSHIFRETRHVSKNFLKCLKNSWKSTFSYSFVQDKMYWNQEISSRTSWNQDMFWNHIPTWLYCVHAGASFCTCMYTR